MTEFETLLANQPILIPQLQKSFEHERLAHAYLFAGDDGVGKHQTAIWLTKHLFCQDLQGNQPCNQCNNCLRINHQEHPDVFILEPDGQTIKVDQIRQLQTEFSKSGFEAQQKVFLIKEADKMNVNAANSLLKFLEEPVGKVMAILETTSVGRILPTIQSRCQVFTFQPLSKTALQAELERNNIGKQTAKLLGSLTNSFTKAVEIYENEWFNDARDSVQKWFDYLKERSPQTFVYIQRKLLKQAKEKEQQQLILSMLLFYYQEWLASALKDEQPVTDINEGIVLILEAEQKLRANVSFQNVAEQLSLRLIR